MIDATAEFCRLVGLLPNPEVREILYALSDVLAADAAGLIAAAS